MTSTTPAKELVILTADKNCQFAVSGLMARFRSLGIRPVAVDYRVHPQKVPGIYRSGHDFLRIFARTHAYALVVMDREGSGRESLSRVEMEHKLENALRHGGWGDRAAAVVIDPELEIWVWSDSLHVAAELGWAQHQPDLWSWLRAKGLLDESALKPQEPKVALDAALREVRKPRSSALYQAIAEKVGLTKCIDPAFAKLKSILQSWFGKT